MVRKAKPKGRANTVKVIYQDGKIGELCGCSRRVVNGINRGKKYYREELSYPIRK